MRTKKRTTKKKLTTSKKIQSKTKVGSLSKRTIASFLQKLEQKINAISQYNDHEFTIPVANYQLELLKLPPYRQLKQNLYRHPLTRPSFDPDSDAFICNCSLSKGGCDKNCHNRLIYTECIPDLCPCTTIHPITKEIIPCANTSISFQRFPATEVFATDSRGFGLRVIEEVPANTIIVEYMGEIISPEEMKRRMKTYKAKDNFYFATLGDGYMVDASVMGSVARFANHSCQPNCSLQRWTVKNETRIVLVSNQSLPQNTEITYQYNFNDDGWKNNPIRSQKCYCGSLFCNGFVGASQKNEEYEQLLQQIERSQQMLDALEISPLQLDEEQEEEEIRSRKIKDSLVFSMIEQSEKLLSHYSISAASQTSSSSSASLEREKLEELESNVQKLKKLLSSFRALEESLTRLLSRKRTTCLLLSMEEMEELRDILGSLQSSFPRLTSPVLRSFSEKILPQYLKVLLSLSVWRARAASEGGGGEDCSLVVLDQISTLLTWFSPFASSSSPPMVQSHQSLRSGFILWDDFLAAMDSLRRCFPLHVPGLSWLVLQYLETVNFFLLSPLSGLLQETVFEEPTTTSSGDLLDSRALEEQSIMTEIVQAFLSSLPGLELQLESLLSQEMVYQQAYWNEYLSIYMDKNQLEVQTQPAMESISRPRTLIVESGKRKRRKKKNSPNTSEQEEEEEYHCYCQLREEEGDHSQMSQCGQCQRWFHLDCLNLPLSLFQTFQKREDSLFLCATCLFLRFQCSHFCFEPCSEWKYKKSKNSHSRQRKQNKNHKNKKEEEAQSRPPPKSSGPTKTLERLQRAVQRLSQWKEKKEEEEGQSKKRREAEEAVERLVAQCRHFLPTSSYNSNSHSSNSRNNTGARATAGKQRAVVFYLSSEEIEQLLETSQQLPLQWSPVIALLSLARQLLSHWSERVQRVYPRVLRDLLSFLDQHEEREEAEALERWRGLAQHLEELLRLYLDLQVLHIRPSEQLSLLRETIWIYSMLPLLWSPTERPGSAVSWRELRRMLDYGELLMKRKQKRKKEEKDFWTLSLPEEEEGGSVAEVNRQLLQRVLQQLRSSLVVEGEEILRFSASRPSTGDWEETVEVFTRRLLRFQSLRLVDLSEEREARLLLCLLRPASLWTRSRTQKAKMINATNTNNNDHINTDSNSSREAMVMDEEKEGCYCWCRGKDNGSEMICCDSCDDWFHVSCLPLSLSQECLSKKKRKEKKCSTKRPSDLDHHQEEAAEEERGKETSEPAEIGPPASESRFYCLSCLWFLQ